jgi:16S rRNA (guanine527-N7)-methyltransferase
MLNILNNSLNELKIKLNEFQKKNLLIFWNHIKLYNNKVNLISRSGIEKEKFILHIIDSITPLLLNLDQVEKSHMDFGSGGGLPGIPLNIVNQNWSTTLVESKIKKCLFLNSAISLLNLNNCCVLNKFLTTNKKNDIKLYDIITIRAVGSILDILPLLNSYIKKNGICIFYKGQNGLEEVNESIDILNTLNFKILSSLEFNLPFIDRKRQLICLIKH